MSTALISRILTLSFQSTATGDQPPTLSSDEESGSSTSSCEEGPGNSATPSGNSSPVPKNKILAENTSTNAPTASGKSTPNNGKKYWDSCCLLSYCCSTAV